MEQSHRRGDRASGGKSKVKEVTHQSRNVPNNLTGNGTAGSDSSRNVDKQRSRLTARVSRETFDGEPEADDNVENTRVPVRRRQRSSTPKDHREADELDQDVAYRHVEIALSSGQLIKSAWNRVDEDFSASRSARKKKRKQNTNVNASTQTTTSADDDFKELGVAQHERRSDDEDGANHDEVDSEKFADMIRLLAAPLLASQVKTALVKSSQPTTGKVSSPDVADRRSNPFHHNHHHHHRRRHHHHHHHRRQESEARSPWQQTAEIMAHPPVVKITSYEMSRAAGRIPAARDSAASAHSCPYCDRHRRRGETSTTSSTEEERRMTLDQLLKEMTTHCGTGETETPAQLKIKLKRAILKHFQK